MQKKIVEKSLRLCGLLPWKVNEEKLSQIESVIYELEEAHVETSNLTNVSQWDSQLFTFDNGKIQNDCVTYSAKTKMNYFVVPKVVE